MELRQILSVLFVFLLLGGALFALRGGRLGAVRWGSLRWNSSRFGRAPARTKSLATMERLALTPQHSLHLVRIQGREVVVATHPHGCTVLSDGGTLLKDDRTVLNDLDDERAVLNERAEGPRS